VPFTTDLPLIEMVFQFWVSSDFSIAMWNLSNFIVMHELLDFMRLHSVLSQIPNMLLMEPDRWA